MSDPICLLPPNCDGLRSGALAAVQRFLGAFPEAVITSGLRTVQDQARAMASNVATSKNWVLNTYAPSPVRLAIQQAIDAATQPADYESIILCVLQSFSPDDLHHLSWHLSGDAFDVQPVDGDIGAGMQRVLQQIVDDHVAAGGQAKFLSMEGGLVRWHLQLSPT